MTHKLFYSKAESPLAKPNIEVMERDIVKIKDEKYIVLAIHDSDMSFNFGRCMIRDIKTYTKGYDSIPIKDLTFVDRKFFDPDHF